MTDKPNLARDAPKKLHPVEIHGGQYHFRNGALVRGLSRKQAAPHDSKFSTTPMVEKRRDAVAINPGTRSRNHDPLN